MRRDSGERGGEVRSVPVEGRPLAGETPREQPRDLYRLADERYHLSPLQVRALGDVGTFRVLDVEDLVQSVYNGRRELAWRDLLQLQRQDLVAVLNPRRKRGAALGRHHYVGLTKPGKRLARRLLGKPAQCLYIGGKKVREMRHDAALYRVFQRAHGQLADSGARVTRVVLDNELKQSLNRELGEAKRLAGEARLARLQQIAERHQLRVVGDQIPLPDLRIEYQTQDGQRERLDIEYLTENYRAKSIGQKAAAGFQLVAERGVKGTVARVTRATDRGPSSRRPDDDSLAERVAV